MRRGKLQCRALFCTPISPGSSYRLPNGQPAADEFASSFREHTLDREGEVEDKIGIGPQPYSLWMGPEKGVISEYVLHIFLVE
jgi:hypothetical protein